MAFRRVAALTDLRRGEMLGRSLEGRKILLVRTDAGIHAYEDRCAHLGVPLSQGTLQGQVITCHAHHFQYDADTGRGINPRAVCLKTFAVAIAGNDVLVDVTKAATEVPDETAGR